MLTLNRLMKGLRGFAAFVILTLSALAHAGTECEDKYKFVLRVQFEDEGQWLTVKSSDTLPINHKSDSNVLFLSVIRLDQDWLRVQASAVTSTNAYIWQVRLKMPQAAPTKFAKDFRPAPDMPMFGFELDPVCMGV